MWPSSIAGILCTKLIQSSKSVHAKLVYYCTVALVGDPGSMEYCYVLSRTFFFTHHPKTKNNCCRMITYIFLEGIQCSLTGGRCVSIWLPVTWIWISLLSKGGIIVKTALIYNTIIRGRRDRIYHLSAIIYCILVNKSCAAIRPEIGFKIPCPWNSCNTQRNSIVAYYPSHFLN